MGECMVGTHEVMKLPRYPSAVSDAPRSEYAGRLGAAGRVRYSGLKGAAPWGGDYAYSIVLGLGEKLGEELLEPARASRGLVG